MPTPIFQVDAFSDNPFEGNPAAVVLLDNPRDEGWMQRIAAEMNLAETAFAEKTGTGTYNLRWFTPTTEVDLCGHATLATAHILWELDYEDDAMPIVFETRSGKLTCECSDDWVEMDFPAIPITPLKLNNSGWTSLGNVSEPKFVGQAGKNLFVQLNRDEEVLQLKPNLAEIAKLPYQGVIVTARTLTAEHEVVSRYFAPAVGIDEDPVTGSAHCAIGPYWAEQFQKKDILAYQASPRGGMVRVITRGDRVTLAGHALIVFRGELLV